MAKEVKAEHIKQAGELLLREHTERVRLEKLAATAELEKKAQRLAFREVELGITEPFKSYEDFLSKVANLQQEDLVVLEKALERGYGAPKRLGDLDQESSKKGKNPFEHYVWTGELELE